MPPHPAVKKVHDAADGVLGRTHREQSSFWRRLFPPREHSFHGLVHFFAHTLKQLLYVPAVMLTSDDIALVGDDVEQVVKRMEAAIAEDESGKGAAADFAPTVYAIRSRYETLYQRGASKRG